MQIRINMRLPLLAAILATPVSNAVDLNQDFSTVQIKVTEVSGAVHMLTAVGKVVAGNITALVGEDGVVIVDNQYAPLVDRIRAALGAIKETPIRFIINTHFHFDHSSANEVLQLQAPVIAHDNARKRLESGGTISNLASLKVMDQPPSPKGALPVLTFGHEITLHLNDEEMLVLHYPRAHTDGDAVVFFHESGVVSMGDIFVTYGFPFIDLASGGSVMGLIAAVEDVIRRSPAGARIVPGHGPVSTLDDLRRYAAMLRAARTAVKNAVRQGKRLDQIKQDRVLDPWSKGLKGPEAGTNAFIETLYQDVIGGA